MSDQNGANSPTNPNELCLQTEARIEGSCPGRIVFRLLDRRVAVHQVAGAGRIFHRVSALLAGRRRRADPVKGRSHSRTRATWPMGSEPACVGGRRFEDGLVFRGRRAGDDFGKGNRGPARAWRFCGRGPVDASIRGCVSPVGKLRVHHRSHPCLQCAIGRPPSPWRRWSGTVVFLKSARDKVLHSGARVRSWTHSDSL
jgi:hypothetical protein